MTQELKHIPGPWRLHFVYDTIIMDKYGRFIASVCGGDEDLEGQDYNNPDEWPILEANARLIAAAPELLEACEAVFDWLGGVDDAVPIRDDLLRVINKAKGRSR